MSTKIKLEWVELKNKDWIIATGKDELGLPYTDASINRVGKKGEVFPDFDNIRAGVTIECEPWKSSSDKWYLFPPKVATTGQSRGSGAIAKAMDRKETGIAKFQDAKELSIMTSSTMRDAVILATAEYNSMVALQHGTSGSMIVPLESLVPKWHKWLLDNWDIKDESSG